MADQQSYEPAKLEQLMLHIASLSERDSRFGAIKLAKLVYFADVEAFRTLGRAITGAVYLKRPNGPVPHEFHQARKRLVERGDAVVRTEPLGRDVAQDRLIALRRAALADFTADEVAIVGQVVDRYKRCTAKELSRLTHETPGWQFAKDNERIPLESACLPIEATVFGEEEIAWAEDVARTL